jgi:hypothetical protein
LAAHARARARGRPHHAARPPSGPVPYLPARPQSLPYQSQSTCIRLSLNLVECLYTAFKKSESDLETKRQAQVRAARRAGRRRRRRGCPGSNAGPRLRTPAALRRSRAFAARGVRSGGPTPAARAATRRPPTRLRARRPPAPSPPPLPAPQLLLSKILECFVAKLGSLRADIPELLEVGPGARGPFSSRREPPRPRGAAPRGAAPGLRPRRRAPAEGRSPRARPLSAAPAPTPRPARPRARSARRARRGSPGCRAPAAASTPTRRSTSHRWAALLPPCCRPAAALLPPCCRPAAALPPPCRRPAAALLPPAPGRRSRPPPSRGAATRTARASPQSPCTPNGGMPVARSLPHARPPS